MEIYTQQRSYFLLNFLLIFLTKFSQGHDHTNGVRIEIVHRNNFHRKLVKGKPPSLSKLDVIRRALHSDAFRQYAISESLKQKRSKNRGRQVQERPAANVPREMSMFSGSDYGEGQYFVKVKIGTPPEEFFLVADTGSTLLWVHCNYRCKGDDCGVFGAEKSSSFSIVSCSSEMCHDLKVLSSLLDCPLPEAPCIYDYGYLTGSTTGIFAQDTVTLGLKGRKELEINDMILGCSDRYNKDFSEWKADGVLGLGYENYSFALNAANKLGGKFSYCLVDHFSSENESSYLIFGPHESEPLIEKPQKIQETKLVPGLIGSHYAVSIKGISIGNKELSIPDFVWNGNDEGGVILDSGSTLTYLTEPAYEPVMNAITPSLANLERVEVDVTGLEFCFSEKGYNESMVPRLAFHFVDGAKFEPPVKSYVIFVNDAMCLGVSKVKFPGLSIIGNIMQQNHLWEFDLRNEKLRFGYSNCV